MTEIIPSSWPCPVPFKKCYSDWPARQYPYSGQKPVLRVMVVIEATFISVSCLLEDTGSRMGMTGREIEWTKRHLRWEKGR